MAKLQTAILATVLAIVGFSVGWLTSPGPLRHHYALSEPIWIGSGGVYMSLPAGTPLVSDLALSRAADRGWWAYVPIYFPDMWDASDMGINRGTPLRSTTGITIRAYRSDDLPQGIGQEAARPPADAK